MIKIMVEEIWRTAIINGETYENYQVSNLGRLMSLNYGRTGKPKLLTPVENKYGYMVVLLYKDGKRKMFRLHRVVAETFLENPDNLPQVNHKDEDKTNNFVGTPKNDYKDGNLEWCTCEYNQNFGSRNERISKTKTNGKTSKKVLQFSKSGEFIREWESTRECERNGFDHSFVSDCCRGKYKSAYGYIWRYKE